MSANGLDFREMRLSDLDAVISMAQGLPTAPQWARADYVMALSDTGLGRRLARVVTDRGRVIGFVVVGLVIPEAEIESVAILPELQGRGFGTLLVRATLAALARAGAATVHLEVRDSNAAARALYRRSGFAETGRRRGYYSHPVEDAVLLSRTLSDF